MTDADLVEKKVAVISTCVGELRQLARLELLETDVRERRFVEHTLQIAIQAAVDIASHIVADEQLGEPESNRELMQLLARRLPLSGRSTRAHGGFRNVLVHGYQAVRADIVREIVNAGFFISDF